MIIRDDKGRAVPSWSRYVSNIAAGSGLAATVKNGYIVPFAIYLADASTIVGKPIDNTSDVTITLEAGYHPIAFESITSTTTAAIALFAYKPLDS